MILKIKLLPLFIIFFITLFFVPQIVFAQCAQRNCGDFPEDQRPACLSDNISCLKSKIDETSGQVTTLKNTISVLSNQIALLKLQIDQSLLEISNLEKEIDLLGLKIDALNQDLDVLVRSLLARIAELYKLKVISPLSLVFSQEPFAQKMSNFQYLKLTQRQIATAMQMAETQRIEFDQQKTLKKQKQTELEIKRIELNAQKNELVSKEAVQQELLVATKNNEANFQAQLKQQEQEFLAIQAICAGQGVESEIKAVAAGEKIATIISGKSCNSDGTHLHFSVRERVFSPISNRDEFFCKNPFNYLTNNISHQNCSSGICDSSSNDPFVPSGSWQWPMNPTIAFFQGFGSTWAIRNKDWLPYNFHNGLDFRGSNLDVKAVQSGTLYQGYYSGIGGCKLQYVMVRHQDSNLDSLYLHVNY